MTPRKRGRRQEERRITTLSESPMGARPLNALRPSEIATYRDARLLQVGPSSTTRELALLSHLYTTAIREWGFDAITNPVRNVRKPKEPRGRSRRWTPDDLAVVEAYLAGNEALRRWFQPALWLLIETAMRRGELGALRWEDVDLGARTALLRETKNGEDRTIPLSTAAVGLLTTLAALQPHRRKGFVMPVETDAITRTWVKIRARTGLQGLRIHDARHEATSRLFELGLSMPEVAAVTGHRTPAMLFRYTHPRVEDLVKKLK